MEDLFYYQKIKEGLESAGNGERALKMKAYMKGQFEFYGVDSPTRKNILRGIFTEYGKPNSSVLMGLTGLMWSDIHREMQYGLMDITTPYLKKMDKSYAYFYDKLIGQKSWWDTVDWLAPRAMGTLLLLYPELRPVFLDKWMNSGNKWYIRSAILFQLHYKNKTDFTLVKKLILKTTGSKEFFINKASGWALREYSKTDARSVIEFVDEHPELHNLTKREALKWIENNNSEK